MTSTTSIVENLNVTDYRNYVVFFAIFIWLKLSVYWILARKIKSNPNQIQIRKDLDLDFKRFFMHGFGFGFDLKYFLKSKSNPNPCMKISLADVASKLRPDTHSFRLFELFLIF